MSKKNNYWVQRAIEQERLKDEIARDYIERTEKQLREYERQLKREIEAFYARYGIEHKMTQKEAMKYLRDDERKEFQEATLEKFREMALDPNADQALLDALSYRHRISRKEALLAEIQSKTAQLYAKPGGLKDTAEQALSDVYVRGKVETAKMFAKAGIIHEPKLDKHMIKERMNFKWTDKHFSERIWDQNRRTYEAIATVLNNGFTGGWSLDRIKKELSAKIKGVPLHRMDTLIKTEATAFNTLAMKGMLIELDTKKYSIVAVIDSRTSEICNHQNEQVYDMDKLEIGVTAPPFHPRCRSTIAPVEDDFDYFQEPEDRKANGKRTLDEILDDWERQGQKLVEQMKYETDVSNLDYMAQKKLFEATDSSGNAIRIKAKKQYGTSFDIWSEDGTKVSRDTVELLQDGLRRYAPDKMPTFVVATAKRLQGGMAAYDYRTDVMYISNHLVSEENVKKLLSDGYFAARNFDELLLHELTHKRHWDRAKALYKANPKKYNSVEDAKHALDEELVSYVKKQKDQDYIYVLNTVSENAHVAFSSDNINELVADVMVQESSIADGHLLKLTKGVLE